MKKQLLILALAAGSALQMHAQVAVPNGSFELGLGDSATGWRNGGNVNRLTSQVFNVMVNGQQQQQTQTAYQGQYFMELRPKYDSATQRATLGSMLMRIPYKDRPAYVRFGAIYIPGTTADQLEVIVNFTKFDFTTGASSSIGSINATSTAGGAFYPWTKLNVAVQYQFNDMPDSVTILILSNSVAQPSIGLGTALFIDDFRFTNNELAGIELQAVQNIKGESAVYPNPVTNRATIAYNLTQPSAVDLSVYDLNGRIVKKIVSEKQASGLHQAAFERGDLNAGLYFYRLQAGTQVQTGKIMIAK